MTTAEYLSISLVITNIISVYVGNILLNKKDTLLIDQTKYNKVLADFCATVSNTQVNYKNLIVLGPRNSGKSSIITLWANLKNLIKDLNPTQSYNTYDYLLSKKEGTFFDEKIQIKRKLFTEHKLKIYDYAGEDRLVASAIERISDLKDCTVVFIFNSDPPFENDNKKYFSRSLVDTIHSIFLSKNFSSRDVKNVFIVFNKIDLFSDSVQNNYDIHLTDLKTKYQQNISFIESIFGFSVNYIITSSKTNHNIINLLQKIIKSYE